MLSKKWNFVVGLFFVFLVTNLSIADWKDNAKAVKISGGADHSLVLTEDKHPWGCGYNLYYQLGLGDQNNRWTPVRVHGFNNNGFLGDINDVSAGWKHSLALDANSSVWAWGRNYYGQLGDSYTDNRQTPVLVHGVNNSGYLKNIVAISASQNGEHSLAVDTNNIVWSWGNNEFGQLGNGESGSFNKTPVKVHTIDNTDITCISAGKNHSMAVDANGSVWTWGYNQYGKLGDGTTTNRNTPVKVKAGKQDPCHPEAFLKNIVAVSAGPDHSMALGNYTLDEPNDPNRNGCVYTWGKNLGLFA